ncbi:MAG: LPS export ABC transporter periplasmic protein LptC [Sinobacteraceae bacterium]|nr:LPS export ABC transporter periplasmic protein LptC [Nevskiaceae bacterium]
MPAEHEPVQPPPLEPRRRAGLLPALLLPALLPLAGCTSGIDDGDATASSQSLDTGYSASDARIVETGPDGQPRYTLRAAAIRQDPRTLEVGLEHLSMEVHADDAAAPWQLRARGGLMPEDASRIDLLGDVRVTGRIDTGSAGTGGEALEIRSETLRYEFGPARVTTAADVTLRMAGRWLQARGLDANLKQRQVRLESNVHGRFAP